ncbi:MAG: peroxiredoxin family protein [Actinomycetota bacterium]|nr:peroxiredoxin family protein [Actinomycetota bacterium]
MSSKSRTRQRQRGPARQGGQGNGTPAAARTARPAGQANGSPGAGGPVTTAAQRKTAAAERRARVSAARQAQQRAARRRKISIRAALLAGSAAVLAGLFVIFSNGSHQGTGAYPYQVGSPGPGKTAPAFTLAASTGGRISLSAYRGKTVLLFFQEGLTCQPCWTQITDLQHHAAQLRAAGISQVISVTGDPIGPVTQKAHDMGLTIPVLSDPGLAVSKQYQANSYGMMGAGRDGHTFILVGPNGVIRWRADYGGAPKYIMFLPTASLLSDMKAGEHPS